MYVGTTRQEQTSTVVIEHVEPNWLFHWSKQELRDFQTKDAAISEIIKFKQESADKPEKSKLLYLHNDVIKLWQAWEVLEIHDIFYIINPITQQIIQFFS